MGLFILPHRYWSAWVAYIPDLLLGVHLRWFQSSPCRPRRLHTRVLRAQSTLAAVIPCVCLCGCLNYWWWIHRRNDRPQGRRIETTRRCLVAGVDNARLLGVHLDWRSRTTPKRTNPVDLIIYIVKINFGDYLCMITYKTKLISDQTCFWILFR